MDFAFSEEQEILRNTARKFLEKECPKTLVRQVEEDEKGHSSQLWHKMAEHGWMGLMFPEEYGGIGGNLSDLAILLEEMGRAALPSPFISTVVLCGLSILSAGSEAQKQDFLPRIANGEIILAFALTEPSTKHVPKAIDVRAVVDGEDTVIHGTKLFIEYGHISDTLLCVARTLDVSMREDGITPFLVDAKTSGVEVNLLQTLGTDKQCEVFFDHVRVPKDNMLGKLNEGWPLVQKVLQQGIAVKCAEMVGGAQKVLEMTLTYATERMAYGQPIGSFQMIQHSLANMWLEVELARNITYETAWKVSQGIARDTEVSATKAWVGEVYRRVTRNGVHIHGAIGVTREHDIGLYHRRARADEFAFGDGDFHREIVAEGLGL